MSNSTGWYVPGDPLVSYPVGTYQVTRTNRLTPNDLQASVYSSLLDSAHVTDRGICSKIARYVSQHMLWITRAMDWDSLHATYGR